jgi:xylose isomerase
MRNSTDLEDIVVAHVTGMDLFARAFLTAHDILDYSEYRKMRKERYASFDTGKGREFEEGRLTLEDMRELALMNGEPRQISGKQELYERILTLHM